jgi:tRNA modification GTPase
VTILDSTDTIAAVASPPGPGLRGLVRLSGPRAWPIALQGFTSENGAPLRRGLADEPGSAGGSSSQTAPLPQRAELLSGALHLDGLALPLPVAIAVWPGPRTYTGQPITEIHTPGSVPLTNLVLTHCLSLGARLAEPGEFTLRAFLSGRIDLTQAEAVLAVIDAQSAVQLDAALNQLAGGLATPLMALRDHLLDLLAHLEAGLDFVDEPDVDPIGRQILAGELAEASATIAALAGRLRDRDRPEGAPRVVLVGPPNAGKSRLFNALVGDTRAIVSTQAGTTRDYLSAHCRCDGLTIELVDTAGIERSDESIMSQAQSVRADQASSADLRLVCESADARLEPSPPIPEPLLRVWTKSDLAGAPHLDCTLHLTSARTGAGLTALRAAIANTLRQRDLDGDLLSTTGARCRDSLVRSSQALHHASATLTTGGGDELVAVDLHTAIDELGKVVGATVTDDILDRIFRRFCIGK